MPEFLHRVVLHSQSVEGISLSSIYKKNKNNFRSPGLRRELTGRRISVAAVMLGGTSPFTGPIHIHRLLAKTHLSSLQFFVQNVTLTGGSGCLPLNDNHNRACLLARSRSKHLPCSLSLPLSVSASRYKMPAISHNCSSNTSSFTYLITYNISSFTHTSTLTSVHLHTQNTKKHYYRDINSDTLYPLTLSLGPLTILYAL